MIFSKKLQITSPKRLYLFKDRFGVDEQNPGRIREEITINVPKETLCPRDRHGQKAPIRFEDAQTNIEDVYGKHPRAMIQLQPGRLW